MISARCETVSLLKWGTEKSQVNKFIKQGFDVQHLEDHAIPANIKRSPTTLEHEYQFSPPSHCILILSAGRSITSQWT